MSTREGFQVRVKSSLSCALYCQFNTQQVLNPETPSDPSHLIANKIKLQQWDTIEKNIEHCLPLCCSTETAIGKFMQTSKLFSQQKTYDSELKMGTYAFIPGSMTSTVLAVWDPV